MKDNGECWLDVVNFHGHECGGLAIGFRAALLAKNLLDIKDETADEDIVCLSETDACGVDAIQVLLKCTVGTGSMRIDYNGKSAFSFYNRSNNKSVRLISKNIPDCATKKEKLLKILTLADKDIFDIKPTRKPFPERAKIYQSVKCHKCGESTAENAVKIIDNKPYCIDCTIEGLL